MKKLLPLIVLAVFLCGCLSTAVSCKEPAISGASKVLAITQNSRYQILYPDLPPKHPRIFIYTRAAAMLQKALLDGVGITAPIKSESQALKGYKSIFIGDTKAARAVGIKVENHPDFGFIIKEKDGNIFIAGQDKTRFNEPEKKGMFWRY